MNCLSCSVSNPKASKFCGNCGASLNFVRPTSSPSEKLDDTFRPENSKPGSEYTKIAIAFPVVFVLVVIGIFVTMSGTSNDSTSPSSNSTESTFVEETQTPVVSTETVGEANAKKKAESYLSFSGFSKKGLIDQLKFEGFTTAEATYGVENIVVDWNVQAGRKAESYMSFQAFSATGLMEQLVFEGFTNEQAAYGAYVVGFR